MPSWPVTVSLRLAVRLRQPAPPEPPGDGGHSGWRSRWSGPGQPVSLSPQSLSDSYSAQIHA